MPATKCQACGGLYDPTALTCDCKKTALAKLREKRRDIRRLVWACLALMGGKGWADDYDCDHGVPIGKPCPKGEACSLHPVRRVAETIALYEKGPCSVPENRLTGPVDVRETP